MTTPATKLEQSFAEEEGGASAGSNDLAAMAHQIRHYLDNRLEQFSNGRSYGSDHKTSGYHAAKVPDWQLRRWLAALEGTVGETDAPESAPDEALPELGA